MARATNFDVKIASTKAKLEKAQERVKALRTELAELETAQSQEKNKELVALMADKGISAAQVVEMIKSMN
jgi:16S rRNA C1402 N4-methylase RsmH